MKPIILSFLLGSLLTAAPAVAFHYFGHESAGQQFMDRMEQQNERFQQGVERQQQELFRNQQRANPC
jgi:hypothetical protein